MYFCVYTRHLGTCTHPCKLFRCERNFLKSGRNFITFIKSLCRVRKGILSRLRNHLSLGGERWGIIIKIRQPLGIPSLISHNLFIKVVKFRHFSESFSRSETTYTNEYKYLSDVCKRKNTLVRRFNVTCKLSKGGLNFEIQEIVLCLNPVLRSMAV